MIEPPMLPPEAPLAMPVQRLDGVPPAAREVATRPEGLWVKRLLLIMLTAVVSLAASGAMRTAFSRDGLGVFDILFLLTFVPLFSWVAFGFISSAIGFLQLVTGTKPGFVPMPRAAAPLTTRTALLVPVYNEEVEEVFARVAAMSAAIAAAGGTGHFDVFILSDSNPFHGKREEAAWRAVVETAPIPIWYRRREENTARKPGNIAEWVRRFGAAYECMLVLDADSMMSGRTMVGMAAVMQAKPSIGLLQTVPMIINARTFFQRWMQFANAAYGPIASTGLLWWSGSESNFWGHNAILRTRAFAESCGLPELPGAPPFGGHILSHDMVESALLRRRGWAVHMVMVEGSYEEFPPTIVDMAIRDRRWMQGNLQHLRLLSASGLAATSRQHLMIGAAAYLTSPGWLLMLLTTVAQALVASDRPMTRQMPPAVLVLTVVMLFGPKLLSLGWILGNGPRRRGFGGTWAVLGSVMVEMLLAVLLAPVTMVTQTKALVGLVLGIPAHWHTQNRESQRIPLRAILPDLREHLLLGLVFAGVGFVNGVTALWLAPLTLGLVTAPWLISLTSASPDPARGPGGLFRVPPPHLGADPEPTPPDAAPAADAVAPNALAMAADWQLSQG